MDIKYWRVSSSASAGYRNLHVVKARVFSKPAQSESEQRRNREGGFFIMQSAKLGQYDSLRMVTASQQRKGSLGPGGLDLVLLDIETC